jgi:hypothetical protein
MPQYCQPPAAAHAGFLLAGQIPAEVPPAGLLLAGQSPTAWFLLAALPLPLQIVLRSLFELQFNYN